MTALAQNDTVSKQTDHLLHPESVETTANRGNILLAPTMHAITEAQTKNKNKGKENRKDPGCRTCAAARRSSTLKEKSIGIFYS